MSSETKASAARDEARPARVPKLRFPEFRGAAGWKTKSLGDVCKLYQAETIASSKFVAGGEYLVYGANGVVGRLDRFNHEHEEVAVSCRGNCGEVHLTKPQSWITGNAMVVSPKTEDLTKRFLFWLLGASNLKPVISGSAQPQITRQGFSPFQVSIPSPAEQRKIAECLSSVDELMAAQARKVDALKTHKKGLMQQLFPTEGETQPRLRFPEFQNAGDWVEKKLGSVCNIQRGKFSHRPRNDPRFFGGPYPFIQTGDVVKSEGGAVIASQSLNEEGLAVSKLFKPTIVLITIAANIGDTGLLQTDGCFTDSVVGLIPGKDVIPVFLELIMRGQKENLNKVATTGAQKNINNEILREVCVLLPSLPEQHRIASCLSSLDTLITAETQKLETLKTHKKGLMQQLFPAPEALEA